MPRRTSLTVVLLVLAGVVATAGLVTGYLRAQVLSPDRFAQRAADGVQASAVRDALARSITRDVIERAEPDVIVARPLIESVVAGVVGSSSFRPVVTRAATELYEVVATTGGSELVLGLSDASVVAVEALRRLQPELAAQLPAEAEDAAAELGRQRLAVDLVDQATTVRLMGIVLPVLFVLLVAGAIAVAPRRRRAAGWVGGTLVAAGLVVIVALPVARAVVVARAGDGDVVAAIWDAFLADLGRWALWLVAAGIVLWLAALGRLQPGAVADGGRRLVEWATAPPRRGWRSAARGAVLLAVALLLVFEWRALLPVVAVGAAVLIGMQGLSLLLGALGPRRHTAPVPDRPVPLAERARDLAPAALVTVLVAGVAIAGAVAAFGGSEAYGPQAVSECNGHDELCERRITEVAFPATHNSMSAAEEPGWYFAEQTGGIAAQLDAGVRSLLIDTWYASPGDRGIVTDFWRSGIDRAELEAEYGRDTVAAVERLRGQLGFAERDGESEVYLCHVACEAGATPFDTTLGDIRRFLERNPGEVLLLVIQDQVSPQDTRRAFVRAGMRDLLLTPPPPGDPWPTLGEMIASGERILVMTENETSPDIPWLVPAFEVMEETPYEFTRPADMSCVPNRGGTGKPFFQLNHWLEQIVPSPSAAARVNARPFLLDRARRCARVRDHTPNVVAVDFYESGDLMGAVDAINGVRAPER